MHLSYSPTAKITGEDYTDKYPKAKLSPFKTKCAKAYIYTA